MISYADIHSLDEEQREEIALLFDRTQAIHELPDDLGKAEAWEELALESERVGFPHLVASARFNQYAVLAKGGLAIEALEAFVALMRVLARHGDLVAPSNVDVQLNSIGTAATSLVDDPSVPLERITRLTDLVEEQMRLRGVDLAGAHVARATVAAAAGDAEATFAWIDRWRAEAGEGWRPDSVGVVQMEVPLIARFDVDRAATTLEQRLRVLDVDADLGRLAADTVDDIDDDDATALDDAKLLTLLAHLRVRQGRRAEATALTDALVRRHGVARLARETPVEWLLPTLDDRPELAAAVVDHFLGEAAFDGSDWEAVAGAARHRLRVDPDDAEGALLRALATDGALAHDRRGGTQQHTRDLAEFWWDGLPPSPRPAVVDVPEIWDDVEERAEHVLAAGWLPRRGAVRADDPPISIKYRYQALLGRSMELLSAESAQEADALAEDLLTRARELRCATTLFSVPLIHGLYTGQHGDTVTLVRGYQRSQEELLQRSEWIVEDIRAIGERFFALVVQQAVLTPAVPWEQIEDVVETERRVRDVTGAPLAPLHLARAEMAAHRDDPEAVRTAIGTLQQALSREAHRLDAAALDLEVVRLSAPFSPGFAGATARRVRDEGDAEQARAASTWLCWFHPEDPASGEDFRRALDEVDGDPTALTPVPGWVVLEVASRTGDDLLRVLDALLEEADDTDLLLLAAAGSVLLALAPGDPRGPELRERSARIALALDARDGGTVTTAWIRNRWYAGDPSYGVGPDA